MWERDKLFRKYCREKDSVKKVDYHNQFKVLRNQVTFEIRNSKVHYIKYFFENNKNDSKKVWKGIRSLITLKNKSSRKVNSLTVNGQTISNATTISNIFNNYFIDIGPSLSKNIPSCNFDFSSYLANQQLNSCLIQPTNVTEINKIIGSMNSNKASGPNSFPTNLLKENVSILSMPISKLINLSYKEGIFPETQRFESQCIKSRYYI